ncbi:hypothetical protein SUGI_0008320 [Cryptomeria japonica]|uniref:uncharacterized protein LOC131063194 n=1 Tax=Cryptomeria japonica TaxID=3369 RepID=UPI002408AE1D|nr:uncharacterized protein LOC131063194 [Cryptomeria japonica]GLJ04982.1 hypothetical protein SUGI_0008320 [Cryptomeria japonica]
MVRETSISEFYKKLRAAARTAISHYPLHIYPSTTDADSLCALKIIISICAKDGLRYSCFPVSSFEDLIELAGKKLISQNDPLAVLLINCGSSEDLRRFFKLGPKIRMFVIDSHRPIHLHNLHKLNKNVIVLYTREDENHGDLAYDFDVSALANTAAFDSDDDEEGDDSESDDSDDSDEEENRTSKRRRLGESGEDDIAAMKLLKKCRSKYYRSGKFYGRPSGMLMFDMAYLTHTNTDELLWLACVSLTDQFVHDRITNERYISGVMELEQHVNSAGHLEMVTSATLKDGTKVRAPDHCRITYQEEPKVVLLREWNLFDSMQCSPYVATKLKTWSENGMKRMKLLLAQMGIPLTESQQKFRYMSRDSKKRLKLEIEKFSSQYGLNDLYYRSFQRHHGYTSQICAADFVCGVTALIESWRDESKKSISEQFWLACSCLSLSNLGELEKGLKMGVAVQSSIFRQGSFAMTKRGFIKSTRGFRWIRLEDSGDVSLMCYPQALIRFCHFVIDALREKGTKTKPLVCACPFPRSKNVLLVGVSQRPVLGAHFGNLFGLAFRAVAKEIGEEYGHFGFDSSWIKIDFQNVNAFMQKIAEKF